MSTATAPHAGQIAVLRSRESATASMIRQIDDKNCVVVGKMSIHDFNDRMGTELPVEEADTLGGFVFGLLGHQPVEGETASWQGMQFKVAATDGRRIENVLVTREARAGTVEGEKETVSEGVDV